MVAGVPLGVGTIEFVFGCAVLVVVLVLAVACGRLDAWLSLGVGRLAVFLWSGFDAVLLLVDLFLPLILDALLTEFQI
jgi:hypothetical protein